VSRKPCGRVTKPFRDDWPWPQESTHEADARRYTWYEPRKEAAGVSNVMEYFNILLVRPQNFIHHDGYSGSARQLCHGLRRLG
jgi:hypothetical protein